MELKLVYRILRKISDWTIAGYYSEVYVEGQYSVPKDGPVIIAATHHNDIIDVATLAATIDHRRPLSFWAKSTLFANPIAGAILSSSGTIPVRRNPNVGNNGGTTVSSSRSGASEGASSSSMGSKSGKEAELAARAALFLNTSKVLEAGKVVGVFSEGASYTYSRILQILPGTAWAAVEYARYLNDERKAETGRGYGVGPYKGLDSRLCIVPVAIEYTDRSRYLSRIYVKYGNPITLDSYSRDIFTGDPNESSKAVVKKITAELEKRLIEMTVNIQDWDTLCAASMARDILWGDEKNVPLKDWVDVMQRLGNMLTAPPKPRERITPDSADIRSLKETLMRYHALLHYAGMNHSVLSSLCPPPFPPVVASQPALHTNPSQVPPKLEGRLLAKATLSILAGLPLSLIRFVLFLPPFLLHLPGYFIGPLLARLLSTPGEIETIAQYKAIGGGLGIGANVILALGILWKQIKLGSLGALSGLGPDDGSLSASLKRVLGLLGTVYCSVVVLVKWHSLLVNTNYRQLQRIQTYWKLLSAFVFPDSLSTAQVEAYTKPEHPAANLFVRNPVRKETPPSANGGSLDAIDHRGTPDAQTEATTSETRRPPKPVASRKLVRHVLRAREDACAALWAYLVRTEDRNLVAFLKLKEAKVPGS